MTSALPALNAAIHLFEGIGELGIEWFLVQAKLWRTSGGSGPSEGESPLVLDVLPDFDFTSPEYARLFADANATAFQHPLWLDRAFGRLVDGTSRSPAVLVGRLRADRRLVFVLPLVRRRLGPFTLLDAADVEVGDYNAFVIDRAVACNPEAVRQIEHKLREMRLVRVRKVRDGSSGLPLSDPSMRTSAMEFRAHEVELATPVDDWQSRILKPDFARFLRSKRKRLAAKGTITFEELTGPDRIRSAFESLRDFRQARWANDLLSDPRHFEFYLDIAVSGASTGFARTYALSVNDEIQSVLFGVCHQRRFCFLLLGFNHRNFRNHSTGLLGLESAIEDCIRRADDVFDLTIGDEGYKQSFATRTVPISVLWLGRRPWTQLAPIALAAAKKARSLVRKPAKERLKAE